MTIDELTNLFEDLEVPEEVTTNLIAKVGESGWSDEVKQELYLILDTYGAKKLDEANVMDEISDFIEERDKKVKQANSDAVNSVNLAAQEAQTQINEAQSGLDQLNQELDEKIAQIQADQNQQPNQPVPSVIPPTE